MKRKIVPLVLLFCTGTAGAVSFDCRKAGTLVEKAICSTPLLGRLDDALAANYKGALATDIGAEARSHLKRTQLVWLKSRNACKTTACIEARYRERIDALCDYPALRGANWGCVVMSDEIH